MTNAFLSLCQKTTKAHKPGEVTCVEGSDYMYLYNTNKSNKEATTVAISMSQPRVGSSLRPPNSTGRTSWGDQADGKNKSPCAGKE